MNTLVVGSSLTSARLQKASQGASGVVRCERLWKQTLAGLGAPASGAGCPRQLDVDRFHAVGQM